MAHFLKQCLVTIAISLIAFSFPFSTKANAFEFSIGKQFFDYGNGAINLNHITYITPHWDYEYTWSGMDDDIFTNYSEVPTKPVITDRVEELYNDEIAEVLDSLDFYFISNIILSSTFYFRVRGINSIS